MYLHDHATVIWPVNYNSNIVVGSLPPRSHFRIKAATYTITRVHEYLEILEYVRGSYFVFLARLLSW